MKMKKRGEDLEVWFTHLPAHHVTGATNTDYQAYPVVSQGAITYNNKPVALEEKQQNEKEKTKRGSRS